MSNVPDPSSAAKPLPPVDLADPAARAHWIRAAQEHARDLAAAALDQVAPPQDRDLGPRQARRIITEAADALEAMFAAAEPESPTPPGAPSPESSPPSSP